MESVIYFAQFLVVNVDEEKRAEIIDRLDQELSEKHQTLEQEVNERIEELKEDYESKQSEIQSKSDLTEADEMRLDDLEKQLALTREPDAVLAQRRLQ